MSQPPKSGQIDSYREEGWWRHSVICTSQPPKSGQIDSYKSNIIETVAECSSLNPLSRVK